MDQDFEVNAHERRRDEIEQEPWCEETRLCIGKQRNAAAHVGIPKRKLPEVANTFEFCPALLPEEIPILAKAHVPHVSEQRMAEQDREKYRPYKYKENFFSRPIVSIGTGGRRRRHPHRSGAAEMFGLPKIVDSVVNAC